VTVTVADPGTDPELDQRRRAVLARASVIAEAGAASFGGAGHRQPDSRILSSVGPATADVFRDRFDRCRDDAQLLEAVESAEEELKLITHAPAQGAETRAQLIWRICDTYEGLPASYVARKEMMSRSLACKLRVEGGREPARGHKLSEEKASAGAGDS